MDKSTISPQVMLKDRVRQVLGEMALKTTGVCQEDRSDPILYVSTLFQRIRNVEYLKRFQQDIFILHPASGVSYDKSSQAILIECFNLIVECINKNGFNEITINAARKCFLSIATEISTLNSEQALTVIKNCLSMSAGEILVLLAHSDAENHEDSASSIGNWLASLQQHTGIESVERLEFLTSSLLKKKILLQSNPSSNIPGKTYYLSELGSAIALSISHGEKLFRDNHSTSHTLV